MLSLVTQAGACKNLEEDTERKSWFMVTIELEVTEYLKSNTVVIYISLGQIFESP